jgi:hypothetical protein
MGKKDDIWYDSKMKDLKRRKRAVCGSISDDEYNTYSTEDGLVNNKTIKKLKEEFRKEKRSYKRAEKQNWKKEVDEILSK